MTKSNRTFAAALVLLTSLAACSSPNPGVKKLAQGEKYSGFLKDYSALKSNPNLDEHALTYVTADAQKHLRGYLAIVIDPIDVYVATSADTSKINEASRTAVTNYFKHALTRAVSSAYPVVEAPGPLVLRLRAALVGVDAGNPVAAGDSPAEAKPLPNALNIGSVGVEMELVDSVSGERIAAMVDKAPLGASAEVGAEHFSRVEKFAAARDAFDEWASRVREFLDSSVQPTDEEISRRKTAYVHYGGEPEAGR